MDIAVLGAGAVGTLMGGLLAHQGHRVLFCCRGPALPSREIRLRLPRQRIRVDGSLPLPQSASRRESSAQDPVDYLLIALKRHQQKKLPRNPLAGLSVRPRKGIILFNNPGAKQLYADAGVPCYDCLTVMNAVLLQQGDVELASARAVLISARDTRLARILAFKPLGFETLEVPQLAPSARSFFLWQLLFLPVALCRSTSAHFLSYPEGREIAANLLAEGLETFRRRNETLGKLPYLDPQDLLRRIKRRPRDFDAARRSPDSGCNPVLQSLLRNRKTEVGELNSRLVRLASDAGVDAAWNWRLAEKLERVKRLGFYRDPPELYRALK
jgi:ketopantoate reductase